MNRDEVIATLRQHEAELKAGGLLHLRVFGSVARGDNRPDSDVDLLFDHDESQAGTVLRAYGLQDRIAEILGTRVHLSSSKYIRPLIREHVLTETVRVF